ncbi:MAG: DUF368 domain-containing protein [bacterium]|nr:DUF368 domain-containing protein [bacterium]
MRPRALSALQGLWIGLAIVLPGISGGTAALMMGIYREFLEALGYFRLRREAWLLAGTLAGVLLGARVVGYLLEAFPGPVRAFLFGLVAGALRPVFREAGPVTLRKLALALAGMAGTTLLAAIGPRGTTALGGLFLAGVAASVAMMLPGVSGSSVLLALGQYERALAALNQFDLPALAALGGGALAGLALLSRGVLYILGDRPLGSIALLGGMMAGSLPGLWPQAAGLPEVAAVMLGLALMTRPAGSSGRRS